MHSRPRSSCFVVSELSAFFINAVGARSNFFGGVLAHDVGPFALGHKHGAEFVNFFMGWVNCFIKSNNLFWMVFFRVLWLLLKMGFALSEYLIEGYSGNFAFEYRGAFT